MNESGSDEAAPRRKGPGASSEVSHAAAPVEPRRRAAAAVPPPGGRVRGAPRRVCAGVLDRADPAQRPGAAGRRAGQPGRGAGHGTGAHAGPPRRVAEAATASAASPLRSRSRCCRSSVSAAEPSRRASEAQGRAEGDSASRSRSRRSPIPAPEQDSTIARSTRNELATARIRGAPAGVPAGARRRAPSGGRLDRSLSAKGEIHVTVPDPARAPPRSACSDLVVDLSPLAKCSAHPRDRAPCHPGTTRAWRGVPKASRCRRSPRRERALTFDYL